MFLKKNLEFNKISEIWDKMTFYVDRQEIDILLRGDPKM